MPPMSNKDAWFFLGYGLVWYLSCGVLLAEGYLSQTLIGTAVLFLAMAAFVGLLLASFLSVWTWPIIFATHYVEKLTGSYVVALRWTIGATCALTFIAGLSCTEANFRALKTFLDQLWGVQ